MKIRITRRDVLFFFIGVFTVIIIDTIFNWEESKEARKAGQEKAMDNDR